MVYAAGGALPLLSEQTSPISSIARVRRISEGPLLSSLQLSSGHVKNAHRRDEAPSRPGSNSRSALRLISMKVSKQYGAHRLYDPATFAVRSLAAEESPLAVMARHWPPLSPACHVQLSGEPRSRARSMRIYSVFSSRFVSVCASQFSIVEDVLLGMSMGIKCDAPGRITVLPC